MPANFRRDLVRFNLMLPRTLKGVLDEYAVEEQRPLAAIVVEAVNLWVRAKQVRAEQERSRPPVHASVTPGVML